ncbi:Serine/threonine-protein kinase Nek6 [Frankliniella fusca]|uniref:Serine/threonine-protein kinase Nek6 n=1 Tax=Frankliniella fusca TaxID=407009 RepID=A0AAE1LN21_9NEOP|nr:Serine/threonine-protein kinase Nek6 [Frankliniella fusca]
MSLRKSGQRHTVDFLKGTQCTPVPQREAPPPSASRRFSDDEALALIDQVDLTKDQYIYIRACLLAHGVDVLPCYDYVRRAKERCYPPEPGSVTVTESEMRIGVQRHGPSYLLYQTDRPGSPRNCRPLRLLFQKETKEVVKKIKEHIQSQINDLVPVQIHLKSGREVTIRHKDVPDLCPTNRSGIRTAVQLIIIHGADIMKVAPVPIGLLSEEPLESRHKNIRHFRKHHTRLCNRTSGNTDLLHCLLVSSDPELYNFRPKPKRKTLTYCKTVLSFLVEPSVSGLKGTDLFESDGEEEFS